MLTEKQQKQLQRNKEYWINRIEEAQGNYDKVMDKQKQLQDYYRNANNEIRLRLLELEEKINNKDATLTDYHNYNRLGKLEENMADIINDLAKKENKLTTDLSKEAYKIGAQIDRSFALPNEEVINKMVQQPWIGHHYSERVWNRLNELEHTLNDTLRRGILQGKNVASIARDIAARMDNSYNNAYTLVRTETIHYLNEGAKASYKKAGCKKVEWYTARDERTCNTCGSLHGQKFDIDKNTIIPAHPRCRCCFLPVVDDIETKKEKKPEKKKELSPLQKKIQENLEKGRIERFNKFVSEDLKKELKLTRKKAHIEAIINAAKNAPKDHQKIIYENFPMVRFMHDRSGSYQIGRMIAMSPAKDPGRYLHVIYHEFGHYIDLNKSKDAKNNLSFIFADAMEKDRTKFIEYMKNPTSDRTEIYKEGDHDFDGAWSDIMGALTKNQYMGRWGHSTKYWNRTDNIREKEIFANIFSIEVTNNKAQLDLVKKHIPNIYKEYKKIIKELTK